jgi:hypothetical protein
LSTLHSGCPRRWGGTWFGPNDSARPTRRSIHGIRLPQDLDRSV